jgi:hypothetical protein
LAATLSAVINVLCALVPNAWNVQLLPLTVGQATHNNTLLSQTELSADVV